MMRKKYCAVCHAELSQDELSQKNRVCSKEACILQWKEKQRDKLQKWRESVRIKKCGDLIVCALCGRKFENLGVHVPGYHKISLDQYQDQFPNSETMIVSNRISRGKGALSRAKRNTYPGKEPDNELFEYLTGTLLGDGSLELQPEKLNARYAEGGNNKEYLQWKHEFLSRYFYCTFNERLSSPHRKSNKQYLGWWIKTATYPVLTEWKKLWYEGKKTVPHEPIEKYLTPFALSVWFCDDGCMDKSGAYIYTMAFRENDVIWLADLLDKRFDLSCSILKNKKGQFYLRFHAESAKKLRDILKSFNLPGMDYKQDISIVVKEVAQHDIRTSI